MRPFLRIGTSPELPERIRQYIGTVVLTERLTGHLFDEAACVAPFGSTPPDYTGAHTLVKAARPFLATRRVHERPIVPGMEEETQGAFVQFFTDGNLHLIINGHHIFDLDQREQLDQHEAWRLERTNRIIAESTGSYETESFAGTGFYVGIDGSLFAFADGAFDALVLRGGGLDALARGLVAPGRVRRVSGLADPAELQRLARALARAHLVAGDDAAALAVRSGSGRATPVTRLVDVLRAVGVEVTMSSDEGPMPAILPDVTPPKNVTLADATTRWPVITAIALPEDAAWRDEIAPPLLRGVPVRVHAAEPDGAAAEALARLAQVDDDGGYARLARLLVQWNGADERPAPQAIDTLAREVLGDAPLPLVADLYPGDDGYTLRYGLQPGFTRGRIADTRRTLERLDALRVDAADEQLFAGERRRLLGYLDELLSERRATLRPSQPPASETTQTDEPEEAQAAPAPATADAPAPSPATVAARTTGASTAADGRGAGDRAPERRRRGGLLIGGAIAALLLILLALWLLIPRADGTTPIARGGSDVPRAAAGRDDDAGGAIADTGDAASPDATDGVDAAGSSDGDAAAPDESAESTGEADPEATAGEAATGPDETDAGATGEAAPTDQALPPGDALGLDAVVANGGGHDITVRDIIRLVNRIAGDNGYRALGAVSPDGRDPDWIYPGNTFVLPDGGAYEVVSGDTLWQIAADYLVEMAARDDTQLTEIRQRIGNGERPLEELRMLLDETYVESVRREARELIQQLEA